MRRIFGLSILIGIVALSSGYSTQPVGPTCTSSILIDQGNNYLSGRSIDHGSAYTCEENLLNSEEENESIKPLAHLFLLENCPCRTLEIYLFSRIVSPASENMILFEADNSPPDLSS